jgi:hypothetical protein
MSMLLTLAALLACTDGETGNTGDSGDTAEEIVVDNDRDNDTILDIHEGEDDPDGDGKPNSDDQDSDGDGIPDHIEAGDDNPNTLPIDTDLDGEPDFLDLDSDNNGILDEDEAGANPKAPTDTDGDGVPDFQDDDNDGDKILDVWEMDFNPEYPPDTDGDGTPDYMDVDSDDDTLCDIWEGGTTAFRDEPIDTDEDGTYDYRDLDSDDDGFSDYDEASQGLDCQEPMDTDNDGKYNSADVDSDGDGLTDVEETTITGTDPYDSDTDNDGQSDGAEIYAGTDPLDAESTIDGLYVEVGERTTVEIEFKFELKIQYGDIGFLIDTTGSMGNTISATADRFEEIVQELEGTFENMAFALATFDDYNHGSMGSGQDKPFILLQQITDSTSDMQAALNAIPGHSGGDGQESDHEALYQAITGNGYDMNCDSAYDTSDDVPPFIGSSGDAFNGKSSTESYDSSVPGTGSGGGMGFRDFSLPIIVYATDIYMRDPDSSDGSLAQVPGGCAQDAGSDLVIEAFLDAGAYLIGIDVGSYQPTDYYSPTPQMEYLAENTGSIADLDGDGDVDDLLVFQVPQGGASFGEELTNSVTTAVEQLVQTVTFDKVHLEITGDDWNLVQSIEPASYENVDPKDVPTLTFTLVFLGAIAATDDDQLFSMTLLVIGDDSILLDSKEIVVVVPGT